MKKRLEVAAVLFNFCLQHFAASSQSITSTIVPTASQRNNNALASASAHPVSGSGLQILMPPQQEPPMLPPAPQQLLPDQCSISARSLQASTTGMAQAEKLYLDLGRPAQCSGMVARWEVCFTAEGTPRETENIRFLVFRQSSEGTEYRLSTQSGFQLVPAGDSEAAEITCQSSEATEPVLVREGDLVGFVSDEGIRVALSASQTGSSFYEYVPLLQGGISGVLAIETVDQSQLQQLSQTVAPLIRVVVNKTLESSAVFLAITPTPTEDRSSSEPPTRPRPTRCPKDKSSRNAIFTSLFSSFVIVAAVVIVLLLVVVCVLGLCLCKLRCKQCWFYRCCCRRRRKKEPISDSMQYNDMYIPRDPNQIIVEGRRYNTNLQSNPAYVSSSTASAAQNQQAHDWENGPDTTQSQGRHRGMEHTIEHTYESIG